ncbi:hypothetical protein Tco_0984169 [Tanacetum coccineum]
MTTGSSTWTIEGWTSLVQSVRNVDELELGKLVLINWFDTLGLVVDPRSLDLYPGCSQFHGFVFVLVNDSDRWLCCCVAWEENRWSDLLPLPTIRYEWHPAGNTTLLTAFTGAELEQEMSLVENRALNHIFQFQQPRVGSGHLEVGSARTHFSNNGFASGVTNFGLALDDA